MKLSSYHGSIFRISLALISLSLSLPSSSAFASVSSPSSASSASSVPDDKKIIPITVLSGFLGSGKTTVLQELLHNKCGLKIGVVVNDVASVNIDSKLVQQRRQQQDATSDDNDNDNDNQVQLADGMVELQNGCACCSLSEELLSSVANLVTLSDMRKNENSDDDDDDESAFDHIVIELSGVADPKAIRAQFQAAVMAQMPLMERVELDTLVTLIDCSTFLQHFQSTSMATPEEMPELFRDVSNGEEQQVEEEMDEWVQELPPALRATVIASLRGESQQQMEGPPEGVADLLTSQTETADLVILNKQDLIVEDNNSNSKLQQLKDIVKALNPRANVMTTSFGKVELSQVLGIVGQRAATSVSTEQQGVAWAGAVDDHRDSVEAAGVVIDASESSSSQGHSHSHAHTSVNADDCQDPACTDTSHSHSHSHDHKNEEASSSCDDSTCTDPSHSHSHSHDHADGESCQDVTCTDPTHDHSHSHDHGASTDPATYVGIGSFVYRARRPFHPDRLVSFLQHLPVVRGIPDPKKSSTSVQVPQGTKEALSRCLRSKGFMWSASSHIDALYWSHAGSSFSQDCLGQWWATLPRDQWPEGIDDYVLQDFDDSDHDDTSNPVGVGDRRQEIVFIGPTLGESKAQRMITEALNTCLLTDEEYEAYTNLQSNAEQLLERFPNELEAKQIAY